jgi:uncharacterized surface protein with fasciclin (FAS1) repeats
LEIAEIDLLPSGALTLFGPTNDAFDALGQGRLAFLTAPANQMELVTLLDNVKLKKVARVQGSCPIMPT